jgi:hypothetical protein
MRAVTATRAAKSSVLQKLTVGAVDESKIVGFDNLARIPILTKEELRSLRPEVLLPRTHAPTSPLADGRA